MATSAGVWIRVSSGGQDEANQVPDVDRHCSQRGYRINKRYEVHDKSAFHGEQQAKLDEMLKDIRAGVIKVVVCWHSDRLERRGVEKTFELIRLVKEAGGSIESVKEPMFGLADISAEALTAITAVMSHAKSSHLSEQVGLAHDRIRENNALLGRAPFGYEIFGPKYEKNITPTDIGRKYVPEMFDRIINGESLATVARWLNAEGVPTACKVNKVGEPTKGWTASTVRQIIRNPVYMGYRTDKGYKSDDRIVRGKCEALVDAATFRRAGERLDEFPKRGPENNANKALLTSHLFCANCASPMYKVTTAGKWPYYRCTGKHAADNKSCLMARIAVIDGMMDRGMAQMSTINVTAEVLVPGHNYDDELEDLKFQIRSLDVDDPEYDAKHAALIAERARVKALDSIPDKWERRPTGETYASKWAAADFAGRRDMLKNNIEGVYAGTGKVGLYLVIEVITEDGIAFPVRVTHDLNAAA